MDEVCEVTEARADTLLAVEDSDNSAEFPVFVLYPRAANAIDPGVLHPSKG